MIYQMGRLIGILLGARLELGFLQCTMNKAILGIHDGSLRVVARLFLHTCRSLVAFVGQRLEVLHTLLALHMLTQIV